MKHGDRQGIVVLQERDNKQEFEITHAERIMKLPNGGGWKLPVNSKYEFVNNGLRLKANTKEPRKAK